MTDHATEAERFHNEYRRIRTPGQLPTTGDVLALANYHATMAVVDAIRGLTPKPAAEATCGAPVFPAPPSSAIVRPCLRVKGHNGAHAAAVDGPQGAPRDDLTASRPEPGQEGGSGSLPRFGPAVRAELAALARAEKAEAALEAARSTTDHFAAERDKYRKERDAVLAEAGVMASKLNRSIVSIGRDMEGHITWRGAVREFIDRYTPEG